MIPIPRSLAYNEVLLPSGVVSGVFVTGNDTGAHSAVYERPEDGAEHDPARERVQKNREGDEKAAQEDVWFYEDRELDTAMIPHTRSAATPPPTNPCEAPVPTPARRPERPPLLTARRPAASVPTQPLNTAHTRDATSKLESR